MFDAISLVYDGQCGFCRRSLRVLERLDVMHAMRAYDAHDEAVLRATFPMLRDADLENAMYAVDHDGHAFRGFFAFRRLIWSSPITWVLLPAFYFPGASWIGPRVYAWIARHRRQLGCESDVCELPPRQDPSA
jgi:predicted DCC family thiol-disulfide oxidoreductase YuxK